jgi:putative ABC transport system permease protein
MLQALALTLRALWWRRTTSVVVLVAAALATGAAVAGPLWSRAAEESLVGERLRGAEPAELAWTLTTTANDTEALDRRPPPVVEDEVRASTTLPASVAARFDSPRVSLSSARRLALTPAREPDADGGLPRGLAPVVWRADSCASVPIVAGHCPRRARDVLLSTRSAAVLGVEVGDRVTVPEFAQEPVVAGTGKDYPRVLRVAGLYRAQGLAGTPAWIDPELFDFSPAAPLGTILRPARLDAAFVRHVLLDELNVLPVAVRSERLLRYEGLSLTEIDAIVHDVAEVFAVTQSTGGAAVHAAAVVDTVRSLDEQRDTVRRSSLLVAAQVLLLAWYVLFLLVSATAEARTGDVALAKLRGLRPGATAFFALAEPLILVLAAAPLGLLLGHVGVRALASAFLTEGTPVVVSGPALVAGAVACAGAATAAALATRRTLTQPVLAQLRRANPAPSTRGLRVVEALLVVLAAVAVLQVRSLEGEQAGSTLGLALPALVALGAGLVTARLLLWAARRLAGRSAPMPAYLAVRQVARRPGVSRVAVLVAVAVGLATFGVNTWAAAAQQRSARAAVEVGAVQALTVEEETPGTLEDAVDRVDPEGRFAVPAAVLAPPVAHGTNRVLAVDLERARSSGLWEPLEGRNRPLLEFTDALRGSGVAPPLEVRGTRWRIAVDAQFLRGTPGRRLLVRLATPDGKTTAARLGPLSDGSQVLGARVRACAQGCRIIGFTVARQPLELGILVGEVTLKRLTVDRVPVEEGFTTKEWWRPTRVDDQRPDSTQTSEVTVTPEGLHVSFKAVPSATPGVMRTDVPEVLPALIAAGTLVDPTGRDDLVRGSNLAGDELPLRPLGYVARLPRLNTEGVLVDLTIARRMSGYSAQGVTQQVWLSDAAPPGTAAALEGAGLSVVDRTTSAERRDALDNEGAALALVLLVAAAGASVVLAVAGVATLAYASSRRRAYELAALRSTGIAPRVLRAAALSEHVVLLGVGALVGAVAALVTAPLALEVLPLTTSAGSGPPVPVGPHWPPVLLLAGVVTLALALTAYAVTRRLVRMSRPALLREAQA